MLFPIRHYLGQIEVENDIGKFIIEEKELLKNTFNKITIILKIK
jgi:hypothetical protein